MLGKPEGEFYCKRGLTIEEAARLHLKQHIDATQFAEGNGPDEAWYKSRSEFNAKLAKQDPETMREAWQRFYFRGELPEETGPAPAKHVNKRRLKAPKMGF